MTRKEALQAKIQLIEKHNDEISVKIADLNEVNLIKFQSILPELKNLKLGSVNRGMFGDARVEVSFSGLAGLYVKLNSETFVIEDVSVAGMSRENVNDVKNYYADVSTLLSFFSEQTDKVKATIVSFESDKSLWASCLSTRDEKQEIRNIEQAEKEEQMKPVFGKFIVLDEAGYRGRLVRTIYYVVRTTPKKMILRRSYSPAPGVETLQSVEETKNIDFNKLNVPSEKELAIISRIKESVKDVFFL